MCKINTKKIEAAMNPIQVEQTPGKKKDKIS